MDQASEGKARAIGKLVRNVMNRRNIVSNHLKKLWREMKNRGENIGLVFAILGVLLLLIQFALVLLGLRTESGLLGASLGLLSVGLGFIAIGTTAKSDKRHTDLLERLDKNLARLPVLLRGDILTPSGRLLAKEILSEQSEIAAQKRLDEDTARVGYVRGEIYPLEDGSWGVHWGGKYPL